MRVVEERPQHRAVAAPVGGPLVAVRRLHGIAAHQQMDELACTLDATPRR